MSELLRDTIDKQQTNEPSDVSNDNWRVGPWLPVFSSRVSVKLNSELRFSLIEEHM